jgi:hypothetical protein
MELTYKKLQAERVGDTEVEYWHAFREIVKVVCRNKTGEMEFPAEWLGWDRWRSNWLWVLLPAKIDAHDLDSVASQIHLSLCSMKIRNVVSVQTAPAAATSEDRESTLENYTKWMSNHGWRVIVTRTSTLGRKLKIERQGFSVFRPTRSPEEIIEQGRWTARAFEALSRTESKDVALYIGEGARHSNFLVSIEW